jgi:hypothetical protein
MEVRQLGRTGPRGSALGLGCMRMSGIYGPADRAESIATIHAALDAGITLLDTGDFCGQGHNELLIAEALRGVPRERYQLSVKFGAMRDPDGIRGAEPRADQRALAAGEGAGRGLTDAWSAVPAGECGAESGAGGCAAADCRSKGCNGSADRDCLGAVAGRGCRAAGGRSAAGPAGGGGRSAGSAADGGGSGGDRTCRAEGRCGGGALSG